MSGTQETIALYDKYVIGNYTRYPVALVRGEGSSIWDAEGKRYLDFFPGWGCGMLGHCPAPVVEAVQKQLQTLIHIPNTWYSPLQGRWAKLLCERGFGGQAFFCNSGAEANEAALKLARLHSAKPRYKVITFQSGFHGRTMGAISATAQPKYHEGIAPLLAGFTYLPYGDLEAVEKAIDDETAAIMLEPIQGEGGVRIPPEGYLQGLRALCDRYGLLLIFDEVQSGFGRTGEWFASQYFGVEPDIMTLAKSLCGGIAGAAMLAKSDVAASLRPGMHAATFGGNPVAAAAGIAAIEMIENEGLLEKGKQLGRFFLERLGKFAESIDLIKDVRGVGVMIGVELAVEGTDCVQACMEKGLLVNCTQGNVIRMLPALNLSLEQAEEGLDIFAEVLDS